MGMWRVVWASGPATFWEQPLFLLGPCGVPTQPHVWEPWTAMSACDGITGPLGCEGRALSLSVSTVHRATYWEIGTEGVCICGMNSLTVCAGVCAELLRQACGYCATCWFVGCLDLTPPAL